MRGWDRFLLGLTGALLLPAVQAYAQSQPALVSVTSGQQLAQATQFQQVAQARSKAATQGAAGSSGDAQLRPRVEQLEQQLLDMQVVIGTLESLARNAGAAAPSMSSAPLGSGADSARIDALETQVRALTAQLEQLSDQIRALGRGNGALTPSTERGALAAAPSAPSAPITIDATPSLDFGATVVRQGGGDDAIGQMLREDLPSNGGSQLALAPGFGGGDPKQDYEAAYGYLLQQNYPAAERAFEEFLQRYPQDTLAGNAQYWLGESLYVRGQYKAAAGAFLKGYQTYGNSAKAPDSLLKLAMSLEQLGQKDAACSSFDELSSQFPNAPSHVKTRARTERQRVGC